MRQLAVLSYSFETSFEQPQSDNAMVSLKVEKKNKYKKNFCIFNGLSQFAFFGLFSINFWK
jgi:hypothetical protein